MYLPKKTVGRGMRLLQDDSGSYVPSRESFEVMDEPERYIMIGNHNLIEILSPN